MPSLFRGRSSSSNKLIGSLVVLGPIKQGRPSKIADGQPWKTYSLPFFTAVRPVLGPELSRKTASTSSARLFPHLPFPSSPKYPPDITISCPSPTRSSKAFRESTIVYCASGKLTSRRSFLLGRSLSALQASSFARR